MAVPADQMMQPQQPPQEDELLPKLLRQMEALGAPKEAFEQVQSLFARMEQDDLAGNMEDAELGALGQKVKREYDLDKQSRNDWEKDQDEHIKVAKQVTEEKSYPWPNAANVKYPLLTEASIQFNARAYPEIVQGNNIAKAKVIGNDEDGEKQKRADRVEAYQNYQLLEEMEDWSQGMDRLLLILPILGACFKKTYFDSVLDRNVSDLIPPKHLVINFEAPSMGRAPRITQEFWLYKHEIESRQRDGTYRKVDLALPKGEDGDEDAPHEFLEQHRREDLDEDGYPEPLIVTIHKESGTVMRVVANFDEEGVDLDASTGEIIRLDPVEYFTKFGFVPNPDSAIYDLGFGDLLKSIQGSIDTTLNQMLDAGHLQNSNFFFYGRGARMRSGEKKLAPGKGIPVETSGGSLRENIYVPQFPGPSSTLFSLLELLIDAGRNVTSLKEVMTGDMPANAQATTVLALIEQGQKAFGAVFKRIHRALGEELQKLYRLNRKYLPPEKYFRTLDENEPMQILAQDFSGADFDLVPVSDPTVLSNQQRLAKAQYLQQFVGDPQLDQQELKRRMLTAAEIEDIDDLWAKQEPPPSPDMIEAQIKQKEVEIKEREQDRKDSMAPFERMKSHADSILAIAKAEGEESGRDVERYRAHLEALDRELEAVRIDNEDNQRAMERMAGQSGDAGRQGASGGSSSPTGSGVAGTAPSGNGPVGR